MANKKLYKISIGEMFLRLTKLQANNEQVEKVRVEMIKDWKDVNKVLYFQNQSYIPEIIYIKLISRHHNNPLIGYFQIEKTQELIA